MRTALFLLMMGKTTCSRLGMLFFDVMILRKDKAELAIATLAGERSVIFVEHEELSKKISKNNLRSVYL